MPRMVGKTVIVTGANSGIGYFTALELGKAGAHVVLAVRDAKRGADAVSKLQDESKAPEGTFEVQPLNLSDLTSVDAFASAFLARGTPVDMLINNAGVMALPKRELSTQGFEMQWATNHLGHFALTGKLMPAIAKASRPRIVNLASSVAYTGRCSTDFVKTDATYSPMGVYMETKLANFLFTRELAKRYPNVTAVVAHPGGSKTNLQKHAFSSSVAQMMLQSADRGAWPSLLAATDPNAKSGNSYAPFWVGHGTATWGVTPWQSQNDAAAAALWAASEKATGVTFA